MIKVYFRELDGHEETLLVESVEIVHSGLYWGIAVTVPTGQLAATVPTGEITRSLNAIDILRINGISIPIRHVAQATAGNHTRRPKRLPE